MDEPTRLDRWRRWWRCRSIPNEIKDEIRWVWFRPPADNGLDDETVLNYVQIKVHDDEDPEDINTVLQISKEDLDRTPEKINIEHSAKADTGMDDDMVVWTRTKMYWTW